MGLIEDAGKSCNCRQRARAQRVLSFPSEKRRQARLFVSLMNGRLMPKMRQRGSHGASLCGGQLGTGFVLGRPEINPLKQSLET